LRVFPVSMALKNRALVTWIGFASVSLAAGFIPHCDFSPEIQDAYIPGCSLGCPLFDNLHKAMEACAEERTCGGLVRGGNWFSLRSGNRTYPSTWGKSSYLCSRHTHVGSLCVFSPEMQDTFIGGCSLGCKQFDTLPEAMAACANESSCAGVTRGGNQFQLRRDRVVPSSSGESSWVCSRQTRCDFSPEMEGVHITSLTPLDCNTLVPLDCKTFDSLVEAKKGCDFKSSCKGVTRGSDNKFYLRSGPLTGSPRGDSSWICSS